MQVTTMPYPHALVESCSGFSIVMNLLGIDEKDIGIKISEARNEIAVLARKNARTAHRGYFWIFNIPSESEIASISTRFRGGVLEISIPKRVFGSPSETAA